MGFHQQVTLKALAREFTAALKQRTLSGTWNAVLTYTNGKTESFDFVSEAVMRKELSSRSKHQVKFIREVSDGRSSGIEEAKARMLETAPRKSDYVKLPKQPEPSALAQAGFDPIEETAITEGCYSAAVQLKPWFNPCQENRAIINRYMADQELPQTAVNFGQSIDYLYSHNHLIRSQRKRGDSPIVPYVSPSPTDTQSEEEVAKAMSFAELQNLVHLQQREAKRRRERPEDRALGVDFSL